MSIATIQDSRRVYLVSKFANEMCLGSVEEIIGGRADISEEKSSESSGGPGQSLRSWFSDLIDELVNNDEYRAPLAIEIH